MQTQFIMTALIVLATTQVALAQAQPGTPKQPAPAEAPTTQPETPAPAEAPTTQPDTPAPAEAPTTQPSTPAPAEAPTTQPSTPAPSSEAQAPAPSISEASEARWRQRVEAARARRTQATAAPEVPTWEAAEPRFTLGVGANMRFHNDVGYDLYGEDDVTQSPEVFASYDFAQLTPNLLLGAEVGYGYEHDRSQGVVSNALDSELSSHHVHAGINLRYTLWSILQPHARIAGGISVVDSAIEVNSYGYQAEENLIAPFLRLGAGLTARLPPGLLGPGLFDRPGQRSLTFGVRFEGGYIMTPKMEVDLVQEERDGKPIPITDASLGAFGRHGWYLLIAGVVAM